MERRSRGVVFQDEYFVFTEFDGLKLEEIVVCENSDTNNTILVYIKVEHHDWHQFFIDFGHGYWQDYEDINPAEEENFDDDDSYRYIDKTAEFGIFQQRIFKIGCEPVEKNCQISIEFENGNQLILCANNPKYSESMTKLIQREKVFSVDDYWDMTIISGVANYKGEPYYFSNSYFLGLSEIENYYYVLTKLSTAIFVKVKDNWDYWLQWLKQTTDDHPNTYAEKRKTNTFEVLLSKGNHEKIIAAEKYYQNQLSIESLGVPFPAACGVK